MALFDGITYHLSETLSSSTHARLHSLLNLNGATEATTVDEASHVVTNSERFEGCERVTGVLATVEWVQRSIVLGKAQPPQYYSPAPHMLFSGVTACTTDLTSADTETLAAGITALGGQFRQGLIRDVTHLFALGTGSAKYETAMHYRADTSMKVLLPHWFDDVVKLGVRALGSGDAEGGGGLDTAPYEWPTPAILGGPRAGSSAEKRALFRSVVGAPPVTASTRDVWRGRRILLSATLGLSPGRREAVEAGIVRAGGVIVALPSSKNETPATTATVAVDEDGQDVEAPGEEGAVEGADVFVTRWRGGRAYRKAMKTGKTVASLAWLFFIESLLPPNAGGEHSGGGLPAPTEQLLHFPLPRGTVSGFSAHKITLTNYTGEAREYLKRLIAVLGGEFTPNMSAANTVVVAAYISGLKTQKAASWAIPIVNHTWLEDCFLQRRLLSPAASPRYASFPPGVDYVGVLGARGVGKGVWDELELEDEEEEQGEGAEGEGGELNVEMEPVGTGVSAMEVEDAVGFGESPTPAKAAAPRGSAREKEPLNANLKPTRANPYPLVKVGPTRLLTDMVFEDGEEDAMDVDVEPKTKATARRRKSAVDRDEEDEEAQAGPSLVRPTAKFSPNKYKSRSKSDSAKKSKPAAVPMEEEEEDDDEILEIPSKSKPKSSAKSKQKTKPKARLRGEESSDDARKVGGSAKKAQTREEARRRAVEDAELEDEDDEEDFMPPKRKYREGAKTWEQEQNGATGWEESVFEGGEREVIGNGVSVMRGGIYEDDFKWSEGKGKKKAAIPPAPFDEDSEEESVAITKKTKVKGKRAGRLGFSDEEESVAPPKPKAKATVKAPVKTKPGKKPPPPESTSESEVEIVASKTKGKAPAKHDSTTEDDEPLPAPTKAKGKGKKPEASTPRRVVSVVLPTSSGGKKNTARTDSLHAEAAEEASTSGSPPKFHVPRESLGKRGAAVRATDRLHNNALDMNNFAQEKKRGFKPGRAEWEEGASVSSIKGVKDEGKKKRRGSEGKRKATESGDNDSEVENRPLKPSKKARLESEGESDSEPVVKKAKATSATHGASTTDPSTVKLMTTQVSLSEEVQKVLTKIGVRFTTKPTECTHLVVAQVVRTEKFLCAMSVAPFILKESWALESAAAKHLLSEERYMLQDIANEKKFKFTLSDALRRAKANRAGVFDGLTFYVTPKVPVDIKLLKAVVAAGGGQVLTQTPTMRILKANEGRHVVSCPADASIWRPLADDFTIYSPELLLTGALKQKIDWKDEANRIPNS